MPKCIPKVFAVLILAATLAGCAVHPSGGHGYYGGGYGGYAPVPVYRGGYGGGYASAPRYVAAPRFAPYYAPATRYVHVPSHRGGYDGGWRGGYRSGSDGGHRGGYGGGHRGGYGGGRGHGGWR